MPNWKHTTKIKHLLTDDEDWESIQDNMNKIADVLASDYYFTSFCRINLDKFRNIPNTDEEDDPVLTSLDYANRLLVRMYDYADEHRIWIE